MAHQPVVSSRAGKRTDKRVAPFKDVLAALSLLVDHFKGDPFLAVEILQLHEREIVEIPGSLIFRKHLWRRPTNAPTPHDERKPVALDAV